MQRLQGAKVFITGGSEGIGLAIGREFARRGAHLALAARTAEKLNAARESLLEHGTTILTYPADIRDAVEVSRAIDAAARELGGLDGIVANGGYCLPARFGDITPEAAAEQIATNLTGTINTLHAGLPHLARRGGFIAITSSPAGELPVYGFSVYGATKAGLDSLARTLRIELLDQGIRVHLLLPPDTDTPGYAQEAALYPPETKAILSGGRVYGPEYVARAFAEGIEKGRAEIAVGAGARVARKAARWLPGLWNSYARHRIREARVRHQTDQGEQQ